jgi:uncharacterized protein YjdB
VITGSVADSANTAIATVLNNGVATGVSAGSTTITAALGTKSGSAALTVNPVTLVSIALAPQAPSLLIGGTRQLAVTATYSNGSTADVTASSTFVSATPANVIASASGLLTGNAAGSSVITATSGGRNATTTATVNAATLSSIAVTPASATVAIAGQQQFVATGTYSDNSTAIITGSVLWSSANTTTATVLNTGVATGLTAGGTTISATLGTRSGSAALTVSPATLLSIAVTPATATVEITGQQQFIATGTYSDNSTAVITSSVRARPTPSRLSTLASPPRDAGTTNITATLAQPAARR